MSSDATPDVIRSRSLRGLGPLELLFTSDFARIFHISGQSCIAQKATQKSLLGSGMLQIVRAKEMGITYLKLANITYPLLPKLRCWQMQNQFIFPVPSGSYWMLDVTTCCKVQIDQLHQVLQNVLQLQSNCLPSEVLHSSPAVGSLDPRESYFCIKLAKQVCLETPTDVEPAESCTQAKQISKVTQNDWSGDAETALDDPFDTSNVVEEVAEIPVEPGYKQLEERSTEELLTCTARDSPGSTLSREMSFSSTCQHLSPPAETECYSIMPLHLQALFGSSLKPRIQIHPSTMIKRVNMPCISDAIMSEDEWDVVVDELAKKNRSLSRRLEGLARIRDMSQKPIVSIRTHRGLLCLTGDYLYSLAHSLTTFLRSISEKNDLFHSRLTTHLGDSLVVDDATDYALDDASLTDLHYFCDSVWKSFTTIGRCTRDINRYLVQNEHSQ